MPGNVLTVEWEGGLYRSELGTGLKDGLEWVVNGVEETSEGSERGNECLNKDMFRGWKGERRDFIKNACLNQL